MVNLNRRVQHAHAHTYSFTHTQRETYIQTHTHVHMYTHACNHTHAAAQPESCGGSEIPYIDETMTYDLPLNQRHPCQTFE